MRQCTKGEWKKEGNKIKVFGKGTVAICPSPTNNGGVLEFVANTHLIATAVNACQAVNLDNPMGVAKSIKDMYEALKEVANEDRMTEQLRKVVLQALTKAEGKA